MRRPKITSAGKAIFVTNDNFIRAESHMHFKNSIRAGGAGRFHHNREVLPVEKQTGKHGNRDTLWSSGVFDLDAGPVTVTLPEPAGRFLSMIIIDEEHYAQETVYGPGKFTYTRELVGTRHVLLGVRTFADADDPGDLNQAHKLQDSLLTEQMGIGSFEFPNWDPVSHKKVSDELILRAAAIPDTKGMFGPRDKADSARHLIGSATGWGSNAPEDAFYLAVVPPENDGKTVHELTIKDEVPVGGFWSISVYGADGYFQKNDQNSYTLNSTTAKKAADGSVTIQFGGCGNTKGNCIPVTPGWNYWIRFYRPRREILEGKWEFPEAQALSSTALYWL